MDGARWRIELFGGLQVRFGDATIDRFEMRRAASVLARLSYQPGRSHAREELIEMLWEDEDPEATRQRFRQVLTKLRRGLESLDASGGDLLIADRNYVRLDSDLFTTDVAEFERELKLAAAASDSRARVDSLRRAVSLYRGELLPGYYDGWITAERERLAETYIEALVHLSAALNACGDTEGAIDHARRAIALDPLREESHCELIRIYAGRGRVSEATRQYRELERVLWKELRALPSAAAQALVESASAPSNPARSIAALPVQAQQGAAPEPSPRPPAPAPILDSSLPSALSRFFGRAEELQALTTLLEPTPASPPPTGQAEPPALHPTPYTLHPTPRLVTLTGAGGSGKTRLALEVAQRLRPSYDTVAFVALENLHDPADIPRALADALLPGRAQSESPIEQLVSALANRTALIVLDNFEHLIDGGALAVRQLLQRTQTLRCLVTSRQRLNIEGEHERSLLPLAVPEESAGVESLQANPSVALFLDRARQARSEFRLSAQNARTIAALCRKLEGIPLAIELTAAWAFTLSPEQMLDRLTRRFNLLVSRRQDSHSRHRSLRAAIEWSYQQLPPDLQACFRKMSAFRGGWTLEAAEAVCDGAMETLQNLDLLRERSLILAQDSGSEIRFGMLETLREFAEEQLSEEERSALWRARRDYYIALVEQAEPDLQGENQLLWLSRLRQEHENLRAVVNACLAGGEIEAGLRLVAAPFRYWEITPHIYEAAGWLESLLRSTGDIAPGVRARALEAAGNLATTAVRDAQAKALLEESLAAYRSLNDAWGEARILCALGVVERELEDFERSRELLHASLPMLKEHRDIYNLARAHGALGITEILDGNREEGASYLETSAAYYRVCGNKRGLAWCHLQQGRLIAADGDLDTALTFMEESRALFRLIEDTRWLAWITYYIGSVQVGQGHFDLGRGSFQEARSIATTIGLSDFLAKLDAELQATGLEIDTGYSI